MRVVLWTEDGPRDVAVTLPADGATVGQLLDAMGAAGANGVLLDGRYVARDHELHEAGLHDGATVCPAEGPAPAIREHVGPWLVATGGLAAGRWWPLAPGAVRIGRDTSNDVVLDHPTVSGRHAELAVDADGRVEVADVGSTNGTWVRERAIGSAARLDPGTSLRLGAVRLEVVAGRPTDRPTEAVRQRGTWSFNRPPRPAPAPAPAAIRVPGPRRDVAPAHGLGWATMLTPIVMAIAMVVVFDNLMFAVFAAISPLTIVGSWWESRRRARGDAAHEEARRTEELDRFRTDVRAAVLVETRRRSALAPHLAEVSRRITQPSTRLWERRPGDADALQVGVGTTDVHWTPSLTDGATPDDDATAVLGELGRLRGVPVPVDLRDNGVVGVVGPRAAAVAVARAIVLQLAAHHGPADLRLHAFTDLDALGDWTWAGWLPHARDERDHDRDHVTADRALAVETAGAWLDGAPSTSTRLVVVDAEGLTEGRDAPVRRVLNGEAGAVAGIVVAETADRLPAACRTVVELTDEDGTARVTVPAAGTRVDDVLAWGCDVTHARELAQRMARFEDAEDADPAAALPRAVTLPTLLPDTDAARIASAWRAADADPGLRAPLGVGPDGPLWLDLVADGPHALVGGTTGSGKSELLRSLVLGLATQVDPAHLNVVLIDYKGGSAFDVCAELPHTVGVVTDLDAHLGARALRCLEAELHHRERVLRDAGASDLPGYLRLPVGRTSPLPRLLVVIDEFATVAAELPEFLEALVGIAQRGRSLGVHLVLATQRPSGVVNDNIRANTNLRIALRVQDDGDAVDVVGVADPARLPRDLPGRAYVRLGAGEVVPVQTAYASGHTAAGGGGLHIRPLDGRGRPEAGAAAATPDAGTDLERLVAAVREAAASLSYAAPRSPWPPPLPTSLDLTDLPTTTEHGTPVVGLQDDPDGQRQIPFGWTPQDGNLLVFGVPGAGTSTTLQRVALAAARVHSADALHLYGIDADAGSLRGLEALPHTGSVVGIEESPRVRRLIRTLRADVDRRRVAGAHDAPRTVLLVDGLAALTAALDDADDLDTLDALVRIAVEGPGVGVHVVASAVRLGDVPGPVLSATTHRWVHRLADAYDLSAFGIPPSAAPALPDGRVVPVPSVAVAQVAVVRDLEAEVADVAAVTPPAVTPPAPVGELPSEVGVDDVGALRVDRAGVWTLPLAVAEEDLRIAGLELHPGEHALVAGPSRSGRSSVLLAVARLAEGAGIPVAAIASRRSPLRDACHTLSVEDVEAWVEQVSRTGGAVLLVDDADLVDDPDDVLRRLAKDPESSVHLVVAGRADALRTTYGHWTQEVRRSRLGLLLRPDLDVDGDLLGTRLPRRGAVPPRVGGGYLVDGAGPHAVQAVTATA